MSAAVMVVTVITSFHRDHPYLFHSQESSIVGGRKPLANGSVGLTVENLFRAMHADGRVVPFDFFPRAGGILAMRPL